jgi:hypothetical protein
MFQRKAGLALALLGAVIIALLTLLPQPGQEELVRATAPTCLVCGELGGVDVILNLLLFVPLGLGLRLAGLPWQAALAVGFASSALVEVLQMKVVPGRDASLSDLLTNTAGALLGVRLASRWPALVFPSVRGSALLAGGWGGVWLLSAWATGLGLRPAPTRADWYGQWAPELGQFDRFPGRLLEARTAGTPTPRGRHPDTPAWSRSLTLQGFDVAARARLGPPTGRIAPIVSVFDADQREIVLLGQWRSDLVYRVRMGTARLRLRNPAVRLPGALSAPAESEVRIEGRLEGPRFRLDALTPTGASHLIVPFSPQWTWALLLPYEYALGAEAGLLTSLWLFGLLLPLGWWAGRAGPLGVPGAAALVVAGIAGTRAILAFDPAPAGEWLAAGSGALLGLALAAALRRLNKSASLR